MPIWISGLSRDEIRNKSIAGAEIKENLKIFLPTPVGFLIIWALKENCLLCVAFLALYFFATSVAEATLQYLQGAGIRTRNSETGRCAKH